MLRCSKECDPGKNNFTFSNRSATFQEAQNLCKQNKKVLAQNLDGFSYAKLLRCCTGHRGTYWIGLKNVAAINCENSDEPGFQWIGKKTCSDGSPLELGHAQHLNNNECKAVTIETYQSDNNPNVPRARVENCNDRNFNYICQAAKQNRNSKTITTTKPTIKMTNSKSSTSETSIVSTISSASTSNKIKTSTIFSSEKTDFDSVPNVWALVGLLIVCSLLLLLAAFLIYRRQSKKFLSKKINCFYLKKKTSNEHDESNQTKIDKTYYKLVFVIVNK